MKDFKYPLLFSIVLHILPLVLLMFLGGVARGSKTSTNKFQPLRVRIIGDENKNTQKSTENTKYLKPQQQTSGKTSIPKKKKQKEKKVAKASCEHWFGGIGVSTDVDHIVTILHTGYPAESCLKIGDLLLTPIEQVRGEVGTEVKVRVHRRYNVFYCTFIRTKICIDEPEVDSEKR